MSDGGSAFSSILGVAGDVLGGVAQGMSAADQEEYAASRDAWARAIEAIDKENRARQERVKSRNEMIGITGEGWKSRSPKLERVPSREYGDYMPNDSISNMSLASSLLKGVSDLSSQIPSDSGSSAPPESSSSMISDGVDVNMPKSKAADPYYATTDRKTQELLGGGGFLS